MRKKVWLGMATAMMLASCGGNQTTKEEVPAAEKVSKEKTADCTYSYNHESTKVYWTAYKHTAKNPVGGTMDSLIVENPGSGSDIAKVFSGMKTKVIANSVNSNDADRDPKIRKSFFGYMAEGGDIEAQVMEVNVSGSTGTAKLNLVMNGKSNEITGDLSLDGENVELKFEINVEDYDGATAVDSLNAVCAEKHTGQDGESVLWPDVKLVVSTTLNKTCE